MTLFARCMGIWFTVFRVKLGLSILSISLVELLVVKFVHDGVIFLICGGLVTMASFMVGLILFVCGVVSHHCFVNIVSA